MANQTTNDHQSDVSTKTVWLLVGLAYMFGIAMRMIWVDWAWAHPEFVWNGQLMINTNDGYFFAAGAQKELFGLHSHNPRVFSMWDYGVIFFTTILAKYTPFSLETIMLYMPALVSSLVVVPVILIARLYGKTLWGFFAALLGVIGWSYYNRTMTGYYDTDMFSAMAPMFIVYFLMRSTLDEKFVSAYWAAIAMAIYPFLYDSGLTLVYATGVIYALYMIVYHRNGEKTYLSIGLIFAALIQFPHLSAFWEMVVKVVFVTLLYIMFSRMRISTRHSMVIAAVLFVAFLIFGNVIHLVVAKLMKYLASGTKEEGLHYFSVVQTVREAGHIPFDMFAKRIIGSTWGLVVAAIGYGWLVWKYRPFILTLPLVGIGVFALWGGLRFTVYAVPIAAMGATFLFYEAASRLGSRRRQYAATALLSLGLLYPNIRHIIAYKVPTVLNKSEVEDLVAVDKIADDRDYMLAWWDYGYPIWYYAGTNTLIDGGKHNDDNFIVASLFLTDSPLLAANLARLAVETYEHNGHRIVTHTLFKDNNPNALLAKLSRKDYIVPKKTRDVYLYMPLRMLPIFPTVAKFANLDLTSGKALREIAFYPFRVAQIKGSLIRLSSGAILDMRSGILRMGEQAVRLNAIVAAMIQKNGDIQTRVHPYGNSENLIAVFLQSYGQLILMDKQTYDSMYVQMFLLGRYDADYFELVRQSPFSRIYKVKR